MTETTLAIIKPDAVIHTQVIIDRIIEEGFLIRNTRGMTFTREQARLFYLEHEDMPFFDDLIGFMSSGPLVWMTLERAGAVNHWRKVIGATDPNQAEDGTLRKMFGTRVNRNAVHGSATRDDAVREIDLVESFAARL